ncbi:MAG: TetR/AcrR family transcriptional regulator [Gammaproteobacteria bacterium]
MPSTPRSRDDILDQLADSFREHGYDGASLARLSEATSLGKASLYHHFKTGKKGMAAAVLGRAGARFNALVLSPLRQSGNPTRRLNLMTLGLNEFYRGGELACLLELFGIGDAGRLFRPQLRGAIVRFRQTIADVLEQAGFDRDSAENRAEEAVVTIQGALVVGRTTGDRDVFQRALASMPERLLARS